MMGMSSSAHRCQRAPRYTTTAQAATTRYSRLAVMTCGTAPLGTSEQRIGDGGVAPRQGRPRLVLIVVLAANARVLEARQQRIGERRPADVERRLRARHVQPGERLIVDLRRELEGLEGSCRLMTVEVQDHHLRRAVIG